MAEETKPATEGEVATTTAAAVLAEEVSVVEKPVTEKELPPAPEPEPEVPEKPVEAVVEVEKPKEDVKITLSAGSFKEETNVVSELPEAQRKALDELKQLIRQALDNNAFTAPPPPSPQAQDEKKEEEKVVQKKEEVATSPSAGDEPKTEEKAEVVEEEEKVEVKEEEKKVEPLVEVETVVVEDKVAAVDEDGVKTVEAIKETIVAVSSAPPPSEEADHTSAKEPEAAPAEEAKEEPKNAEPAAPPSPPEEVFIWGFPLLGDEKSDVILLKFLRARDFKVKEAFAMIKNTVKWRKEFGIDALLEEDLGTELDKVVFGHGVDKEGHPVCYNVYGAFQDKELYQNCFADEEKRVKFLRWRIQFLEKSIRTLDFIPTGISTIFQVNDLKNSPVLAKAGLRQATNQALTLLQDNYPEFVAKQVFVNVPWWYLAFNRMISPFLTQRTKSKFVFAGPSKSAETLFKYIAPEQVPVQYGGLSREGEQEFSVADSVTEVTIKPTTKHTIEFPVSQAATLVWELRVVGWDVSYGAEFVPSAEDGYTVIVSKTRKVTAADEPVISDTFKVGESGKIVLTIDNHTSRRKKLLYRSKTKSLPE